MNKLAAKILLYTILMAGVLSGCADKPHRRVLVIHSYDSAYAAYPEFNQRIADEFSKKGIDADLHIFYLNCERYLAKNEIARISDFLDSISSWKPEIILVNEDQATYSLFKTNHPLLREIPTVFAGVNFPNWETLKQYPKATGFHDRIDFIRNFDLMRKLFKRGVETLSIMDATALDRKIDQELYRQIKGRDDVVVAMNGNYKRPQIDSMIRKGIICFEKIPVRSSKAGNTPIVWMLSQESEGRCYLQTKRDYTTINASNLCTTISLTTINDGFGFKENLLGGYITPLSVQVEEEVDAAVRILNGEFPVNIPIAESKKRYVIDWNVLKRMKVPEEKLTFPHEILHQPFREKHFVLWLLLVVSGVSAVVIIILCLLFLYRREEQRKRNAMAALADRNETLALTITGSDTFAWKLENGILTFEDDFRIAQGIEPQKLDFEKFKSIVHPDHWYLIPSDWFHMPLVEKKIMLLQCDFNGKGYQWWEFRYTTTRKANGDLRTAGLLLNIQTVKEREQELEEARRLAEKAELKESFLANMSHEIRTPLNAIVGFSNILTSEEDLSVEEKQEFIDTINKNSELLLKLINDILELSRIESGYMSFKYEYCQVSQLVNTVYLTHHMLIPPQLEFIKEEDENQDLEVYVDNGRLTQVLTNFLNNAAKFTKFGFIKLGYHRVSGEDAVRIYVEDSGKGISKEEQKIVFNRFYKQNEFSQGAGLGLSICKVIVDKLNGRIELESEPGKGSRFSVILPLTQPHL